MALADAFRRVKKWLSAHAPRTHASLLPPVPRTKLTALAKRMGKKLPPDLVALYSLTGGQSAGSKAGVFRGYFMVPIDGVDGLESEWEKMCAAEDAKEPWASRERFPFAKDYAGSVLCVDGSNPDVLGPVLEILEGDVHELAEDVHTFLGVLAIDLEDGTVTIDETIEEVVETFEVIFDAARVRAAGASVTHSVFTKLGIDAKVELLEMFHSTFDTEHAKHGFYVRLHAPNNDVAVETVRLLDEHGRPLWLRHGSGSGAGSHAPYVFVTSTKCAIPQGARLHVTLKQTRRF